jgi:Aldehyde dehydrogenase family
MSLQSFNARTGQAMGPALPESSAADIDAAVQSSAQAFETWSSSTGGERAALLRALASGMEAHREQWVALADEETALGPIRLNGELDRRWRARPLQDTRPWSANGCPWAPSPCLPPAIFHSLFRYWAVTVRPRWRRAAPW